MCNKCPTVGDLFCGLLRCVCCEPKCERKCDCKPEHKPEPKCEMRFECTCRDHKPEDNGHHEDKCDQCDKCACRIG